MAKHKSIFHQLTYNLKRQFCFGTSKHQAKIVAREEAREAGRPSWGIEPKGVFQSVTFHVYAQVCRYFADYCLAYGDLAGIKIHTLAEAKPLASRYIQARIDQGISPHTLMKERSALRKAFMDREVAADIELPKRHKAGIVRSRGTKKNTAKKPMSKRFSEKKNADLIFFTRNTGLRKSSLRKVLVGDIYRRRADGRLCCWNYKAKGGKSFASTIPRAAEKEILRMVKGRTKDENIFKKIPTSISPHVYRRDYAQLRLDEAKADMTPAKEWAVKYRYAIEFKKKYGREANRRQLDQAVVRAIKKEASNDLGHNRISVITASYSY